MEVTCTCMPCNCYHTCQRRNPVTSSRPDFAAVVEALASPDPQLLKWREGDTTARVKAALLGTDLAAGREMFKDLQSTYAPKIMADDYAEVEALTVT